MTHARASQLPLRGRVLAVDHGDRRTGLAISDALGITAQPLEAVREADEQKLLARIVELAAEREVERILVGLPLNMDGSEGPRARIARRFGERLAEETGLPVEFSDERLTSVQAGRVLAGRPGKRRRGDTDVVAAQIFLQGYLDRIARQE